MSMNRKLVVVKQFNKFQKKRNKQIQTNNNNNKNFSEKKEAC